MSRKSIINNKICYSTPPWIFNGIIFTSDMINNYYGFVYIITNKITNQCYIGRKYFYKSIKKKGKRRIYIESDWQTYWSSSKLVHEEVKKYGNENFKREILSLHGTRGDVNYYENFLLFKFNVLEVLMENGERKFYNDNIMNRYYSKSMERVKKLRNLSDNIKNIL